MAQRYAYRFGAAVNAQLGVYVLEVIAYGLGTYIELVRDLNGSEPVRGELLISPEYAIAVRL